MSAADATKSLGERLIDDLHMMEGYGVSPRQVWLHPLAYDALLAEVSAEIGSAPLEPGFVLDCNGVSILRKVLH